LYLYKLFIIISFTLKYAPNPIKSGIRKIIRYEKTNRHKIFLNILQKILLKTQIYISLLFWAISIIIQAPLKSNETNYKENINHEYIFKKLNIVLSILIFSSFKKL